MEGVEKEIAQRRKLVSHGRSGAGLVLHKSGATPAAVSFSDGSTASSESEEEEGEEKSWIDWFTGLKGNEFLCEVDADYIEDDFNLHGLSSAVSYFDAGLDVILDVESADEGLSEAQLEMVEGSAELLYGLIHARFILTARGLSLMHEKFKQGAFGRCPRVLCQGQAVLPTGQSDTPRTNTVKLYCPRCEDIYYPRSKLQGLLDGAWIGTSFAHVFMMTYPDATPPPKQPYIPRIFGYRVHKGPGPTHRARLLNQAATAPKEDSSDSDTSPGPAQPAPQQQQQQQHHHHHHHHHQGSSKGQKQQK